MITCESWSWLRYLCTFERYCICANHMWIVCTAPHRLGSNQVIILIRWHQGIRSKLSIYNGKIQSCLTYHIFCIFCLRLFICIRGGLIWYVPHIVTETARIIVSVVYSSYSLDIDIIGVIDVVIIYVIQYRIVYYVTPFFNGTIHVKAYEVILIPLNLAGGGGGG